MGRILESMSARHRGVQSKPVHSKQMARTTYNSHDTVLPIATGTTRVRRAGVYRNGAPWLLIHNLRECNKCINQKKQPS